MKRYRSLDTLRSIAILLVLLAYIAPALIIAQLRKALYNNCLIYFTFIALYFQIFQSAVIIQRRLNTSMIYVKFYYSGTS